MPRRKQRNHDDATDATADKKADKAERSFKFISGYKAWRPNDRIRRSAMRAKTEAFKTAEVLRAIKRKERNDR